MDFMRVFSRNLFNLYDITIVVFAFNFCRTSGAFFHVMTVGLVGSAVFHLYEYAQRRKKTKPTAVAASGVVAA